jgi:hypothetical protein
MNKAKSMLSPEESEFLCQCFPKNYGFEEKDGHYRLIQEYLPENFRSRILNDPSNNKTPFREFYKRFIRVLTSLGYNFSPTYRDVRFNKFSLYPKFMNAWEIN